MSQTYHHGNLEVALLDAAEHLLKTAGLSAVTLRACARHAAVSHAAPTHHFGNLNGLLVALATRGLTRLGQYQQAAFERHRQAPPVDQRKALGLAYISFALDEPAFFFLFFSEPRIDRRHPDFWAASQKASQWVQAGEGASLEAQQTQWARAWSLVHGYAVLARSGLLRFNTGVSGDREQILAMAERVLTEPSSQS